MASNRGGVQRVLAKLNASVEKGDYYEAHQMYRTLYFRYKSQKKYVEAIDLLYSGATTLLAKNQGESGTDLALLLIELLKNAKAPATEENIGKIGRIHKMIGPGNIDRPNYIQGAVKWTKEIEPDKNTGHPLLHKTFALTFWEEKNYAQSRYHFLHSEDGEGCAAMLVEYQRASGYPCEVDLFVAQAVLQYLCLRNTNTASVVFFSYTKRHPAVEDGPPFDKPLLNFCWFLLLAIEAGKITIYSILCEHYQAAINRDPSYKDYLDRIGQLFFGLKPPKKKNDMFGNLLQNLFGMGDDSDMEEGDDVASSMHSQTTHQASPPQQNIQLDLD
ncbi:unnamed protein product [Owenia fusiformis]|uniref:Uncharacterized protein n=1 Tax=Owenia fusiformis TaxID=6347 RepID=A0A8J1Y0B0_OWEFU|nr:unnamed protein product [Owenia fusiformis]